jgi:hypothetical protein
VAEAVKKSVQDIAAIPMEWREKILKLSLEEKEKMDREEEDHIKEAIELGMVDASRW